MDGDQPGVQERRKLDEMLLRPNEVCLVGKGGHQPLEPVFSQKLPQEFQARIDHRQPVTVFQVIVVMLKGGAGIVGRKVIFTCPA